MPNINPVVGLLAILGLLLLLRRANQLSSGKAHEYLASGALIVDVRTQDEFSAGHLPGAISVPLDEIDSTLPERVHDLDQIILLHCKSGVRSTVAMHKLKAVGYTRVFNLGSYSRAKAILASASQKQSPKAPV